MIKTPHWQLKTHLYYIRTDGKKKSYDARLPVLLHLIMSSNASLRCFVGVETLCRDTGFTNKPIIEALQWLQNHGAIYNVPKEQRVGSECRLHANKKVWQLTSFLQVDDNIIDYLYAGKDESESKQEFDAVIVTITENAPDCIKNLYLQKISVQNPPKLDGISGQSTLNVEDNPISDQDIPTQNTPISAIDGQNTPINEQVNVQNPSNLDKISGQSTREVIKKNKDIKLKEVKITLRDERDDFILNDIFTDDVELTDADTSNPAVTKATNIKPYTPAELDYFKDSLSLSILEIDVYNPCHQTLQPRSSFTQPSKSLSDWQQLVIVVEEFFPSHSVGYATKIAQQLANTATSGQRKIFGISPPMNATEACAFAYWLCEAEGLDNLPERSERIQERAMQFRALVNHFEHVNYARYILADLLGTKETIESQGIDSNLFKPAPKEMLDKVYAEAEALLGFSVSGEF